MTRLVDDLMDITRIKRGGFSLHLEVTDARPLIETAVEMVRPGVAAAQQTLRVTLPGEPVFVRCDTNRLIQVVGNLLMNAYKFTPDGGTIELTAWMEGSTFFIEVQDTGRGMAEWDLERAFDLFAQIDVDRSAHRPVGLGVGLPLAREIVARHQGSLKARSAGVGLGSTFTIELPVSAAGGNRDQTDLGGLAVLPARRILIIDDNRDAADAIRLLLTADGHEAEVAYAGRDALDRIRRSLPEVVLLDLGMPDMSGYEVIEELRASPITRDVFVVALTGWGQDQDIERTRKAGFDGHLVKPVGLKELRGILTPSEPTLRDRSPSP